MGCRHSPLSRVLAAQHKDVNLIPGTQVKSEVWSMHACDPSPREAATGGSLKYSVNSKQREGMVFLSMATKVDL